MPDHALARDAPERLGGAVEQKDLPGVVEDDDGLRRGLHERLAKTARLIQLLPHGPQLGHVQGHLDDVRDLVSGVEQRRGAHDVIGRLPLAGDPGMVRRAQDAVSKDLLRGAVRALHRPPLVNHVAGLSGGDAEDLAEPLVRLDDPEVPVQDADVARHFLEERLVFALQLSRCRQVDRELREVGHVAFRPAEGDELQQEVGSPGLLRRVRSSPARRASPRRRPGAPGSPGRACCGS